MAGINAEKFIVTLTRERMLEAVRRESEFNIAALIEKSVPSAKVVSGSPRVSVCVAVNEEDESKLRKAVNGVCTVIPYYEVEFL